MRFLRTHTARQPNVRPGFDPYKLPHERHVLRKGAKPGRAETGTGSVHEHPVAEGHAPNPYRPD